MRRTVLVALLAAAGATAICGLAAWAQDIDSDPCQRACDEQKAACVDACGTENDAIECDEGCDEQLANCLSECD